MDYDNEDQQAVEVDPSYAQLHSRVGINPETAVSRKEQVTGVPAAGDDWERDVKKLAADVWGRWLADILIDETSGDVATGLDNGPGTKRYLSAQERIAILRAALRALAKANGYLPNFAWGSMPAPVPEPGFVAQMVKAILAGMGMSAEAALPDRLHDIQSRLQMHGVDLELDALRSVVATLCADPQEGA